MRVCIIGTGATGQGGVAGVTKQLLSYQGSDDIEFVTVNTHVEGNWSVKAICGIGGFVQYCFLLLRRRIDLTHAMTSSRASFWRKVAVSLVTRPFGIPVVVHVHGSNFVQYVSSGSMARKVAASFLLGRSAAVIVLGEGIRQDLLRMLPDANIHVVPNAVAIPPCERNYGEMPPTVVSIGRLGERKGTFTLIRAFATMDMEEARLILAGDGDEVGAKHLSTQLGIEDQVSILGWVGDEERDSVLANSTVFALPSLAEGLPLALLEAMAHGLPVIATPVGAIPEVVESGASGLLVNVGDEDGLRMALSNLLCNPAFQERLGTAARATVQSTYSLDSVMTQIVAIWRAATK
jgi:glycosyltransferase involved in cell wall biosynthesis